MASLPMSTAWESKGATDLAISGTTAAALAEVEMGVADVKVDMAVASATSEGTSMLEECFA